MTGPGDVDRDDIEDLLPWYATGRLSPSERTRVQAYLARHPGAAAAAALAKEEAEAAIAANAAIPGPSSAALDRLMASIASAPQQKAYRPASTDGIFDRLAAWLSSLSPQHLGYAAAALITMFVVQAVTLGTVLLSRDAVFETATGPVGGGLATSSADLLIGFVPEATMADVTHVLKANGLTVVDGPRAGLYRVRAASASADTAALASKLKASPIVASVLKGG